MFSIKHLIYGLFLAALVSVPASARDLRFVEFAQYGANEPDSPAPDILRAATWAEPMVEPDRQGLAFVAKATLYLNRGITDILAPDPEPMFKVLLMQDFTAVEGHTGIEGAPVSVCMYGPDGVDWTDTTRLDDEERLALAVEHTAELTITLFWDIIDHPPYHDIADHPLRKIGPFRGSCPGETTGPGKQLIEEVRLGLAQLAFERAYEAEAPVRDIRKGTPNFRLRFASEAGIAVIKTTPRIATTPGAKPNPLTDPPPFFLRFVPMRVQYRSPGSTGLTAMDFYPVQNLLTERFSGLPDRLTDQVTPVNVVAARGSNKQQQYQICRYNTGNVAYWVWSTPFELSTFDARIEPSTASPQRPVFSCPLQPPGPWR